MIEIVPAIDIMAGRCVRLTQGDYAQCKVYGDDPVAIARQFEEAGVRRLHLVDLDGAKEAFPKNLNTVRKIVLETGVEVEYGGGIKSTEALKAVFDAGVDMAICGSVAVTAPHKFAEWIAEFGPGRIILGADVRDGKVATHGWLRDSEVTLGELIARFAKDGLRQVVCTDISKDGTLTGPAFAMYEALHRDFPAIDFTVSGGISSMEDIERLDKTGLPYVIVGKAFYEGAITLTQIRQWMQRR